MTVSVDDDELHSRLIDAGKSGDLSQRAFVEAHLTHPTGFVRAAALRVVTSYWKLAEHEATALRAISDDGDCDVREVAAYGLSNYAKGPSVRLDVLLDVVLDEREDEIVRDAAYHSALVLSGIDRSRYPWQRTIPGFEQKADWALLARLVAACGARVPAPLAQRAA